MASCNRSIAFAKEFRVRVVETETSAGRNIAVPVELPQPGEYVALGAAVQAAWALTGTRPNWPVAVSAAPTQDTRAVIREQYRARSA